MTSTSFDEIEKVKCPLCKSKDKTVFVFSFHHNGTKEHFSPSNPSDYNHLLMCENLHVFDTYGDIIEGNV